MIIGYQQGTSQDFRNFEHDYNHNNFEMYEGLKNLSLKVIPFDINPPRKNNPIQLTPMKILPQPTPLSAQILKKIGVQNFQVCKQKQTWFQSLLPSCTVCSCGALSRETLEELDSRTMDIENKQNQHLKEQERRNQYMKIFEQKMGNMESNKKLKIFEELYVKNGGKDHKGWVESVNKYYKNM